MSTPARVQLPAWIFQVQTTSRSRGGGSQNHVYAGDAHFQERQNDTTSLDACCGHPISACT